MMKLYIKLANSKSFSQDMITLTVLRPNDDDLL